HDLGARRGVPAAAVALGRKREEEVARHHVVRILVHVTHQERERLRILPIEESCAGGCGRLAERAGDLAARLAPQPAERRLEVAAAVEERERPRLLAASSGIGALERDRGDEALLAHVEADVPAPGGSGSSPARSEGPAPRPRAPRPPRERA